MPRWSISTWSLHPSLGEAFYALKSPDSNELQLRGRKAARVDLLDVPAEAREHGVGTVEVCHFHYPSVEPTYLASFRKACDDAGVELYSVLIDAGDITAEDAALRDADLRLIRRWIAIAGELGASRVRIDAGLAPPTPAVIERSATHLRELAEFAKQHGVQVITENWHETSKQPGPLLDILSRCGGGVGLCCDFGNAEGPGKHDTIAKLAPHATSIHAKAAYGKDGTIDEADLATCCRLVRQANFDGPISLIRGTSEDEWTNLMRVKDVIAQHIDVD